MSVAILVDQDVTWQPDKKGFQRVLVPPAPEKLKIIHDLVAGITGFTAERGDQLVIETLPFETTLEIEPPPQPGTPQTGKPAPKWGPVQLDPRTLTIGAVAGGAAIVLGLAVLLYKRKTRRHAPVEVQTALPPGQQAAPAVAPGGVGIEDKIESKLAERDALQKKIEAEALNSLKLSPVITKTAEVLAKHLREKIKQEPEISAQILRTWIREEES
jgi:flagellar biosynthesis/type III secretory pathway M-ring protein FliF/YscJ